MFAHKKNYRCAGYVDVCMVAERFTPSPGDAPPGPDSALNKTGLRIPGSMAPDSAISETGVRTNELKIPDSGLRIVQYRTPDYEIAIGSGSHNGRG